MSTHTKSKLYILIIGILLVTNIVMLFFFLNKDEKGRGKGRDANQDRRAMMRDFLQKQIGFDTVQLVKYDTLSKEFKEKSKISFDSLRSNKEVQFKELGTKGFSETAIDSIVNKSAENQKKMEWQMIDHFATIRKICTAEQQPKFDSLFYKIWSKKKKPDEKKADEKK